MYRQCSWQLHKKSIFFLLIGCWALFSFQSKENYHRLQNDIQQAICSIDPNVHAGIEIVSLKNGQHLFQQNENHLFVPASNLKIITAAAALHILGSNYRFETKLFTDGKRKRHEIQGNLYIKGSPIQSFRYAL